MPDHSSLLLRVRGLMKGQAAGRTPDDSAPRDTDEPPPADEPAVGALSANELEQLEAAAKHHRTRLALYRARIYAMRPTSPARLRELERRASDADERLTNARRRPS